MNTQYGVFNQKTGVYEKFDSLENTKARQNELLLDWMQDVKMLFGLCVYETKDDQTVKQYACDDQGQKIVPTLAQLNIAESWFHLPIKTGQWGDVNVREVIPEIELPIGSCPVYMGSAAADWWMGNDHTYMNGFGGLRSQYYNASGRVLLGGLGLGMLTLLLSNKPEVTEVVVCEINSNVIEAFRSNGWDESKITIVTSPIQEYQDRVGFDWILLDHVNQSDLGLYAGYQADIFHITQNVGQPRIGIDCYTWEELYYFWLEDQNKEHSYESFLEFSGPLQLPQYTPEVLEEYLAFYDNASRGLNSAVDLVISDKIKQFWLNKQL